jgi:hypothetical protein
MRDLSSDDYASVAGAGADRLIPDGLRRGAGAAVFLGLVGAMGLWSYGLGTRDAGEVPVIRAMEGPARVQPADPGGLQAAHQGLEVNALLAGRPASIPDAAPPPAPAPAALAEEDGPQGELILAAPARLVQDVLAAEQDLRMPPQEDGPESVAVTEVPEFAPSTPEAGAEPALPAAAEPAAPGAGAPRPRGRPTGLAVARAAPPTPAAAPAAPEPAAAALVPGTRLVQLGAFDSETMTREAWARLVARHGDLLGSKQLHVERATSNARVFYRLRVAGFQDSEATRVMCEALRARGVDCIPVTLQ